MRSLLRPALAFAVAGVLAACTDEPTSAPTGPVAPRALPGATAALNLPATCDPNQSKTYGRGFANKSNDPLFSLIGDLPGALRADGSTAPGANATDKVFDALARIAAIRGTTDQKTDATGANFDLLVRSLLKCASAAVTAAAVEPPNNSFGGALGRGWVFEVRGKTADGAGGAYERGSLDGTWWAAWPKQGTWADAIQSRLTNERVLIYGFRTSSTNIPGRLGSTFEHRTIPKIDKTPLNDPNFVLTATVGLCFADANQISGQPRVNHDNIFLPLLTTPPACDIPAAFTPTTGSLVFGRLNPVYLARSAARYVWPQPLYAATMFAGGSVTGSPDDFSPSAVWDLSQFNLSGLGTITDGKTSEQIHTASGAVTLNVTITGGGNAPDGTPVTVSVVGNNSVIAFFSDNGAPPLPTATRYVSGGVVSFAGVNLTKAGGYQIQFQVAFDGISGTPTPSNSFNIQNK